MTKSEIHLTLSLFFLYLCPDRAGSHSAIGWKNHVSPHSGHGHEQLLFIPQYSQLIGQFKQVMMVFENLGDRTQVVQMVSLVKKGERLFSADINMALETACGQRSKFLVVLYALVRLPLVFLLIPPVALEGIIMISGYKFCRETDGS